MTRPPGGAVYTPLSWADFDRAVESLAAACRRVLARPGPVPGAVLGEPRGGLPLAVALSHRLDLPLTGVLPFEAAVFWVDDVLDRGVTYRARRAAAPRLVPVLWAAKGEPHADALVHARFPADSWLVFPWEDPVRAAADHAAFLARRSPN